MIKNKNSQSHLIKPHEIWSFWRQWVLIILLYKQLFKTDITQKMKLSYTDFSSKCDQIRRNLWIWSHLLEKSLM